MALAPDLLDVLFNAPAGAAWKAIVMRALEICGAPLKANGIEAEIGRRDRLVADLDQVLATSAWDLWPEFQISVRRTADCLAEWWQQPYGGKAVLILDGLSLRELPWLHHGAKEHGFVVHGVSAHASEFPAATTEFAKALGFAQRSALENNGAGSKHRLPGARTECSGAPWKDAAGLIGAEPNWCFWHTWPDDKVHDFSVAGGGYGPLALDAAAHLSSDDFWSFARKLGTGRRLVVTSDHGYAATGLFADAPDTQKAWLRDAFGGQRYAKGKGDVGPWSPPLALAIGDPNGQQILALGRRKWPVPGGYPTLAHGGLTLLETLSPWVELSFKEA